jgi:hypothetical protein
MANNHRSEEHRTALVALKILRMSVLLVSVLLSQQAFAQEIAPGLVPLPLKLISCTIKFGELRGIGTITFPDNVIDFSCWRRGKKISRRKNIELTTPKVQFEPAEGPNKGFAMLQTRAFGEMQFINRPSIMAIRPESLKALLEYLNK